MSGCKKDTMYMDTGIIIGYDVRMGPCEGGTYININGHQNPNRQDGLYDIDSLPASFKIDNSIFPIKVTLDWKVSNKCFGNYINVSRIAHIK
jgi:hypothetical protein